MVTPALIVFDLDDTLYLERDFVISGFAAADAWFRATAGVEGLGEVCLRLFAAGERSRVFDQGLKTLGLAPDHRLVVQLIEVYQSHRPSINLTADAARYFGSRSREIPCAMITDGRSTVQRAKTQALGIEEFISCIICTGALGQGFHKPHPRAFARIETWAAPMGLPLAYVADNPVKDFVTPRARGWCTVQIVRPERIHHLPAPSAAHEPHARITSLDALDECLAWLQRDRDNRSSHASTGM
ncbi:HAD family hydrolase [Chelativorans salis]|uniref:HAD family hydrolase n=1 Tax=Chelativorans salis TaxID=2978478 RepID=A0ABT2LTH4_9HYPH|nr:HAD family hydrolase [Chelativorans sp. EGI FJ00035]MCT7376918.1 HAD family hydrolase [Chelativorans sp. EGI FJ00035]